MTTPSEPENAVQYPQINDLTLVYEGALSGTARARFLERLPVWISVHEGLGDSVTPGAGIIAFDDSSARAIYSSPEAHTLGALILVECTPPDDLPAPGCPVLLVCGRQSSRIRHEQQVAAFERLERGRIVELESCGGDPLGEQPEQLAETVRWFLSKL